MARLKRSLHKLRLFTTPSRGPPVPSSIAGCWLKSDLNSHPSYRKQRHNKTDTSSAAWLWKEMRLREHQDSCQPAIVWSRIARPNSCCCWGNNDSASLFLNRLSPKNTASKVKEVKKSLYLMKIKCVLKLSSLRLPVKFSACLPFQAELVQDPAGRNLRSSPVSKKLTTAAEKYN